MSTIFRATKQHALNLAKFVSLYKTFLLVQRKANGGKERSADTFFAGLLGGYLVFGDRTAVNEQVSPRFRVSNAPSLKYSSPRSCFTLSLASSLLSFRDPHPLIQGRPPSSLENLSRLTHALSLCSRPCLGERLCGCSRTERRRFNLECLVP